MLGKTHFEKRKECLMRSLKLKHVLPSLDGSLCVEAQHHSILQEHPFLNGQLE